MTAAEPAWTSAMPTKWDLALAIAAAFACTLLARQANERRRLREEEAGVPAEWRSTINPVKVFVAVLMLALGTAWILRGTVLRRPRIAGAAVPSGSSGNRSNALRAGGGGGEDQVTAWGGGGHGAAFEADDELLLEEAMRLVDTREPSF